MGEILDAISKIGFPIVVAMYSLVRLEKVIWNNTIIITKLYEKMSEEKEND